MTVEPSNTKKKNQISSLCQIRNTRIIKPDMYILFEIITFFLQESNPHISTCSYFQFVQLISYISWNLFKSIIMRHFFLVRETYLHIQDPLINDYIFKVMNDYIRFCFFNFFDIYCQFMTSFGSVTKSEKAKHTFSAVS